MTIFFTTQRGQFFTPIDSLDNVHIERFWWTIKYEDIHLKSYETVAEARAGITAFIKYYNEERPHQSLKYKTPYEVYFNRKPQNLITPSLAMPVKSTSPSGMASAIAAPTLDRRSNGVTESTTTQMA